MRSIWMLLGPLALVACAQTPPQEAQDETPVVYTACEKTEPTGSRLKTHVCWTADQKEAADRDVRTAKGQMERSRPAPMPGERALGGSGSR